MKILFLILAVSLGVVLINMVVLWWRVRRQLRRSNHALKTTLPEIQPEQESIEKS
jgi:hypothetical protein